MDRMRCLVVPIALALLAGACGDDGTPGTALDGSVADGGGGGDAAGTDGAVPPTPCTGDAECDDGAYCNGAETCAAGRCAAGAPPCATDMVCVETGDRCASAGDWTSPTGIPEPEFCVRESHRDFEGMTYAFDTGAAPYPDAGDGPYTHYVDGSAGCTDTDNPYGSPGSPRCTPPRDLSAGSVVEIHGGPYDLGGGSGGDFAITAAGSVDLPVFVRGVDDGGGLPLLIGLDQLQLRGSYLAVETLRCDGCRVRFDDASDHACLRRTEITNHPSSNGVAAGGSHAVIFANEIHHHQGDDRHGITVVSGSRNVWVLDNDVHHNGGDGIQFCHGCTADPPENVYIGRNAFHSDRENGVDLKYGRHVVVSENLMFGYRSAPAGEMWCFDDGSGCGVFSSGSDGSAMVIGSDGAPEDVWVLLNEVRDSTQGIRNEESFSAWLIGNLIHDIEQRGIALEKRSDDLYILHNTIHDVDVGIDQFWRETFRLHVVGNIFSMARGDFVNIESSAVADASDFSHNLFFNGGDAIPFRFVSRGTATTAAELDAATGGSNHAVGDPRFVDAPAGDLHCGDGSAAVDAAIGHTAYADYETSEGIDIARDLDGMSRPAGAAWDCGAFER